MIEFILSLFTEKKCLGCQQPGHFFCPNCSKEVVEYEPYCYICKKYSQDFLVHKDCREHFHLEQVIVLTRYRNHGVKKLLRHAKYYNKYGCYKDLIVSHRNFFVDFLETEKSVLIPVPMHYIRRWKRGYNQSDIIAQNLGKVCQIPVNNNFLKRVRITKQQSHLSQSERMHNLDNAFALGSNIIDNNTVIYLVDDVVSTGSTLNTIAGYLQENGFKNIRAIVLASD